MFTDTPHFVLIGRNSANLDNFRREISIFCESELDFLSIERELSAQKALSGIFLELEDEKDLLKALELAKVSSPNSNQVPIIVIFDPLKTPHLPRIVHSSTVRLMKRPLLVGEIAQEVKNLALGHIEGPKVERLSGIRQFISGLNHEMGNILLRIMGGLDLAMMEEDVKQIHKRLQAVQGAAERARSLVRNLQDFAKTSSHVAPGRLSSAFEGAFKLLEEPLRAKNVTVKRQGLLESAALEPQTAFDSAILVQAFYNLIKNALCALPETGGTLLISLSQSSQTQGFEIKIIDNGAGMTPDILKRAFEVGFSTHKDTAAGTGLPIAREFILSHGGSLTLNSTAGKGTEISIWLPGPTC